MRKSGEALAYDKIKKITRGKPLTKDAYLAMVGELDISSKDKNMLLNLSPKTYLGEIDKILEDI